MWSQITHDSSIMCMATGMYSNATMITGAQCLLRAITPNTIKKNWPSAPSKSSLKRSHHPYTLNIGMWYKIKRVQLATSFLRESQLSAHHPGIIDIPRVVTHCPPLVVKTDFHSTFSNICAINQSHISISTHCYGVSIIIISLISTVLL